jgi:hypothetical protein
VTLHRNHEANHGTEEADNRSRPFGSLFPAEEFQYVCDVEIRSVSAIALNGL